MMAVCPLRCYSLRITSLVSYSLSSAWALSQGQPYIAVALGAEPRRVGSGTRREVVKTTVGRSLQVTKKGVSFF